MKFILLLVLFLLLLVYPVYSLYRPRGVQGYRSNSLHNSPHLFHKYVLKIADPNGPVEFETRIGRIHSSKKKYAHIHCQDVNNLSRFLSIIREYHRSYNMVVTYSQGNIPSDDTHYHHLTFLKIRNKGADIGGKLCFLYFLYSNNLNFDYIFCMHSKTDLDAFHHFLLPFQGRCALIDTLLEDKSKRTDAIFPNYHNITYDDAGTNHHACAHKDIYMRDFFTYLNIPVPQGLQWFNATNTFIFSKRICDFIFKDRIPLWYNILNENNSYDYLWHAKVYRIETRGLEENYNLYRTHHHVGNAFHDPLNRLRDGCVEHVFERVWVNVVKHLGMNYLCLPTEKIADFYRVKINAVYFPQYHDSKENNQFWGKGFTEWTLLRPFPDEITLRGNTIPILKPHKSIGYYSLDHPQVLQRQMTLAKQYGIHGFIVYHYWFGNDHRVLHKVEDHLFHENDFPFCFSWANEPWTKNWDGLQKGILIDQHYEDDHDTTHILYLLRFFQKPNYMRTTKGECLFYIYNYTHIKSRWEKIHQKWVRVLDQHGLKIKVITTKNSDVRNHNHPGAVIQFEFMPLCQGDAAESFSNHVLSSRGKVIGPIPRHYELDYNTLLKKYNSTKTKDHLHLGLALQWNNIVRKKNMPHYHTVNFSKENLEKMLLLVLSKIILRFQNRYTSSDIPSYNIQKVDTPESEFYLEDNIIIVNAWNEWNEQAVLEPNHVTGFENLETIHHIISTL